MVHRSLFAVDRVGRHLGSWGCRDLLDHQGHQGEPHDGGLSHLLRLFNDAFEFHYALMEVDNT